MERGVFGIGISIGIGIDIATVGIVGVAPIAPIALNVTHARTIQIGNFDLHSSIFVISNVFN